ncbi:MAG: hypothetical protein WBG19_02470 [Thermoplasmata archaeon]
MAEGVATVLLVAITVVLSALIFAVRFPITPAPPNVSYQIVTGGTRPVWGDPTDCHPDLPQAPSYYLGLGKSVTLYNDYMNAWWADCDFGDTGTYNLMNVSAIQIVDVSVAVPLADVEFQFICTNTTPKYVQTTFVQGPLSSMEWVPGSSQNLSASAPKIGKCATYDASGMGANSVYYNRLGYFDPVDYQRSDLAPGQTIIIYVHTPNSVLEAPNPIEPVSSWNISDADDYHGAPPWCFTVPGACAINLIDTEWRPGVILTTIPLWIV